jgi:hypothetical protein
MPRKKAGMSGSKLLSVIMLLLIYISIVASYTLLAINEDIYPFDLKHTDFLWTIILPVYTIIWIFLIGAVIREVSVGTFAKVATVGVIAISIQKIVWFMYIWDDYMWLWIPLLLGTSALFMFVIYLVTKNIKIK